MTNATDNTDSKFTSPIQQARKTNEASRKQLREALNQMIPSAIASLQKRVDEGDLGALQLIASRVLPVPKSTMEPVKFSLPANSSLVEKCDVIMQAIATAKLPPDIGLNMLQALNGMAKVIETEQLAAELAEIKKMLAGDANES